MNTLDSPTLHEEHQDAECEHVMWLEDIGQWRSEHRRAAAMLAQTQAALLEQDAALESHAEIVRSHESYLQRHEWTIAAGVRADSEPPQDVLTTSHQTLQGEHDQAREAHQRIKEHHDMFMTEIRQLSERLSAPM